MNRQQKENLIQSLNEKFIANEASFVVNYQGLSVGQMQKLRLALDEKGSEVKVAKNRLVKLAIQGKSECEHLGNMLRGQTAIIFAKKDLTGTAKTLYEFAKENEELTIVAGCYASRLLDKQSVEALAKLPPREVLLAQLCGTLKAPITGFVSVLNQMLIKFPLVLKAIAEKKK